MEMMPMLNPLNDIWIYISEIPVDIQYIKHHVFLE
jgi:hypothetical protein